MATVEAPGGDGEIERVERDGEDLDRAVAVDRHGLGRRSQLRDLRRAHEVILWPWLADNVVATKPYVLPTTPGRRVR